MKSIKIDGVTRYYAQEGKDARIILVHGSLSSRRQWRALIDRLRDGDNVIAIDLLAREHESTAARG